MAYLRLNISNLCNFSCKYCHVFKIVKNEAPMKIMSYETMEAYIESFVSLLRQNGETSLTLSIYGGEPLINKKNLFKSIEKYQNKYQGININWVVNTNGSLLTENVSEFFKQHDIDVHLSIDGFEETHNKNRIDKFGKPTFNRVEKALNLIQKHGLRAQINSFVFPENVNNLFELVDIAKNFGIHKIYLDLFYDTQGRGIKPRIVSEKYFKTFKYCLENRVQISGPWDNALSSYFKVIHSKEKQKHSMVLFVTVKADGKFFFNICPTMPPLNIEDMSYECFTKEYRIMNDQFKTLVKNSCKYCFLRNRCNGDMIIQFQSHTGLNKGWKNACASARETVRLIKNFALTRYVENKI